MMEMGVFSWLQWVEEKGLITTGFLRDAEKSGIMETVSLRDLHRLSWNDVVYCIFKEGRRKPGSVFCHFPIEQISGVTKEAYDILLDRFSCRILSTGGDFLKRTSEMYLEGATCEIEASLQEICDVLAESEAQGDMQTNLRIGCAPDEYEVLPLPWIKLSLVAFSGGIRRFDSHAFRRHGTEKRDIGATEISLPSHYEVHGMSGQITGQTPGRIQWANQYDELPVVDDQLQMAFSLGPRKG